MLITSRCAGMFDRNRLDNQDFQFLDMFEHSIGLVTDRESQLFSSFNWASEISAEWLRDHRRRLMGGHRSVRLPSFGTRDDPQYIGKHKRNRSGSSDHFLNALLDIGAETSLLAEIKDIRDELNIIKVILDTQLATVSDFEMHVTDELYAAPDGPTRRTADAAVAEVRKRGREQARGLEVREKDVWRMDQQAESLYHSLTDLLDLKQKHSNALEAGFAGDQSVIAARQGQTIMVFTIVTIIFLPMSFIAAFFAINLQEWEGGILTIAYVSKYMFGIGLGISIPLIAMAFTVTDIADAAGDLLGAAGRWLSSMGEKTTAKRRAGEAGVLGGGTYVIQSKASMSSQRYVAVSRDRDSDIHQLQLMDIDGLPTPRMRSSRERSDDYHRAMSRLSPVSGYRVSAGSAGRKVSFGSANATMTPWSARPSLDRSRGRRVSEDLEKGRDRPAYGR